MLEGQFQTRETFFYAPPRATRTTVMRTPVCHAQMHPGVYKIALACWLWLLGLFALTFFASANAFFMVVIDAVYAVMFFGVPLALYRVTPKDDTGARDFWTFLGGSFDTIYGPIRASEALLQVIMVPLMLGIGGIAISLIIHSARAAY